MELRAWIDYRKPEERLAYWRSLSGYEVDFVLGESAAIEVKSTTLAQEKHLSGLRALQEEGKFKRLILVCREERPRKLDGIEILPWREFLGRLWANEFS